MSITIKLNQVGDIQSKHHVFLEEKWYQHFSQDEKSFLTLKVDNGSDKSLTHTGLIYYFHLCWAKEIGAILRPDMLWFTIISEISQLIIENPNKYRDLFTNTDKKQNIVTLTNDETEINLNDLMTALNNKIVNKDFMNLIVNTQFESNENNAHQAILMTFAQMATPYFNYITTMCGIPHVEIDWCENDWILLYHQVKELKGYIKHVDKYFDNILNIIASIIYHCFGKQIQSVTSNKIDFFNDIFHYGKNTHCMSGHDSKIVSGWIKKFYISNNDNDLYRYNKHLNYVPYKNLETGRKFCYVTGLTYSEYDKSSNTLIPHYGTARYEVTNEETFNKLALKGEEIDG